MKTLIKNHYSEPHVDSVRILRHVLEKSTTKFSIELLLLPIIAVGALLMIFFSFLLGLNMEFLSTVLSIYYTLGSIVFLLSNLIIGISLFIMEYGVVLMFIVATVTVVQVGVFSYMRSSFQRI